LFIKFKILRNSYGTKAFSAYDLLVSEKWNTGKQVKNGVVDMQRKLAKKIKLAFTVLAFVLLIPTIVAAGFINLPRDANGWTVFTPSDDTRICYISANGNDATARYYSRNDAAVGSDPFNPVGPIYAYATFAAALANTRDGYPDWILFKRGETFVESAGLGSVKRSGRNATEPFLIGSYGPSGNSPVIIIGTSSNGISLTATTKYLAVMGLDFYCKDRNPHDGGSLTSNGGSGFRIYLSSGEYIDGLLIEGCKFRYFTLGMSLQRADDAGDIDIEIRRNLITDSYDTDAHSQGIYSYRLNDVIFEENILIHNGWYQQQSLGGANEKTGGQATQFNHNIYWASAKNVTIRRNLFIDGSSSGIKLTGKYRTSSTTIRDNLFIGNEIMISIGNNYRDPQYAYRFPNVTISDNVATHGGRLNPTNRELAWGFWLCGLDGAVISNNLLINADNDVTNSQALSINSDESRNVQWRGNIIYNWGFGQGLRISAGSAGSSNISFVNNKIQLPDIENVYLIYAGYDVRGEWSFSGNRYYADSQSFYRNGITTDLSGWNSWSGDAATWSQVSFLDVTRDIDTYMRSIGKTGTIDAFVAACRSQDRYNWNQNYQADKVNAWIRAGFFTSNTGNLTPPPTPQNLRIQE